jgi:hypothetical protein
MRAIIIGDVFEIATHKGKGYFQYVFENKSIGQLTRVLPGLFREKPEIEKLVSAEELFLIHFPVKAAFRRKIISFVGNFAVPPDFKLPMFFRDDVRDGDGNLLYWHIVDYKTWKNKRVDGLTDEQKKLSPWGIWNDTLLIKRLEQGWTLDNWN